MCAMSIFYQVTNSEPSTATGDAAHEPSVTCAPTTPPSIGRIIEVSWVRNDTLRFDVDCIRREHARIGDNDYETHVAGYSRHVPHRLIHN
jgi:hypothetical protein